MAPGILNNGSCQTDDPGPESSAMEPRVRILIPRSMPSADLSTLSTGQGQPVDSCIAVLATSDDSRPKFPDFASPDFLFGRHHVGGTS
ncbi:hypothetical protein CKAH01_06388 [Colletotrichum kahawae]|uniref:Uncharacterized protein n=1 Tax=Colletotrichum kahawae TaxID=34407 RepID=A0AAE0D3N2_COLKA|nr:hypothetical protein CKAH01_06388 [Colletotrichum kahawae]